MSLHRYLVKPFVGLRATLRKGWNHKVTLIWARVWRFVLGVRVGAFVHLVHGDKGNMGKSFYINISNSKVGMLVSRSAGVNKHLAFSC
jgi:hypothetical protein